MALDGKPGYRLLLFIFVVCIFVPKSANGLHRKLSAEEEIQFTREFRLHNKPAVKIIKTVDGERYSCVDFYKQPAFDHPLLKNHSYNYDEIMGLSSVGENRNVTSERVFKSLWIDGEVCPPGTVPIKKYTKSEFIRAKLFQEQISPMGFTPYKYAKRAIAHAPINAYNLKQYTGASGRISVYNLPMKGDQYTAGHILVSGDVDGLQAGSMVNPSVFGDNQARIFMVTESGEKRCFNTLCTGFVVTSRDIALGTVLTPASERGSKTYDFKFGIIRNPAKEWQLELGDQNTVIGFWPNKILRSLSEPAEYVEWGGEASPTVGADGPGMGSGFFPTEDIKNDGFVRQIYLSNTAGTINDLKLEIKKDDPASYKVIDKGVVDSVHGHVVVFGGPGPKST